MFPLYEQILKTQINHQPDATFFQFIILSFIYSSICFRRFPAHHQELNDCSGSLWFYLRIVVTVVLLFVVGPAGLPAGRPDHEIFPSEIMKNFTNFAKLFSGLANGLSNILGKIVKIVSVTLVKKFWYYSLPVQPTIYLYKM
jgi:hypothetical protein